MTIEEARQGEHVTWRGYDGIEEGTIHRPCTAGVVLIRRPGNSVLAAVPPELLTLTADIDRLF